MALSYIQDALDVIDAEMGHRLEPGQAQLYALLLLIRGEETTESDVHDAWGIWRVSNFLDHPALVPWHQLEQDTILRQKDRAYMLGIHKATRRFRRRQLRRTRKDRSVRQ